MKELSHRSLNVNSHSQRTEPEVASPVLVNKRRSVLKMLSLHRTQPTLDWIPVYVCVYECACVSVCM